MPPHIDAYLYYIIWKKQFHQVGMFYHTNCASYIRHTYMLIKSRTDSSPGHTSFTSCLREWTWRVQTQLQNELRPVSVIWWMINMMANNIKPTEVHSPWKEGNVINLYSDRAVCKQEKSCPSEGTSFIGSGMWQGHLLDASWMSCFGCIQQGGDPEEHPRQTWEMSGSQISLSSWLSDMNRNHLHGSHNKSF